MDKQFSLVRQFTNTSEKPRFCVKCGDAATQEALFAVGGGVSLVERYCDLCVKSVK